MPRGHGMSDELRAAVAADIEATAGTPDGSYRKIAGRHSCSVATVQKVAEQAGLKDAWQAGRAQTAAATEVTRTSAAAKRAQLQLDLLDDAQALRKKLFGDVVHLNVVKEGGQFAGESVEETVLPAGPRDWRDTMSAIGVATSKAVELARLEAEQAGTGQVSGLLEALEIGLRDARHRREQQAAGEQP
ncbi:MAG TPA: hypothetical protein VFV67_34050 [Actinophytocola sp.]|uniref:hypothetical protein n=1 Tax=Actinophytocola sp. TaxID=1872138 RepID=UPI002DB5627A|nr:hypothetical protein [Actinophytocola sp.]HEU5475691.1 hypothetical protein [Actinophytocola sp.]